VLPPPKLQATDGKDPLARKAFQSQGQSSKTSPAKKTDLETKAAILLLALQILQAGNSKIVSDWIVLEPAMHCWFFYFLGLNDRIQNKCNAFATIFATFFNFFFLWPCTVKTKYASGC
jgi:hypothetical protein